MNDKRNSLSLETISESEPVTNLLVFKNMSLDKLAEVREALEMNKTQTEEKELVEVPDEYLGKRRLTYAEYYLKTKRSGSLAISPLFYTDKQIEELTFIFELFDFDNDGLLSIADLARLFNALDPKLGTKPKIQSLIYSAAPDLNDDKIDITQFCQYFGGAYFGTFTSNEFKYAFDILDRDGDGYLDVNDLQLTFEQLDWHHKFDLAKIISSMSEQDDGRIDYEDFKKAIRSSNVKVNK